MGTGLWVDHGNGRAAGRELSLGRRGQRGRTGQCLGNWDLLKLVLDGDPSVQHPMPEGFALGLRTAALVDTVLWGG